MNQKNADDLNVFATLQYSNNMTQLYIDNKIHMLSNRLLRDYQSLYIKTRQKMTTNFQHYFSLP